MKHRPSRMLNHSQAYRLMPWVWSAAWLLTGVGSALSDIFSKPSQSLVAYFVLGAVGWAAAGFITASVSRNGTGTTLRLAGWVIAGAAAILLGLTWLRSWDLGIMGPPAAIGAAGALAGAFSSSRSGIGRLGTAVLLGIAFFLFAVAAYYLGAILGYLYGPIAQVLGDVAAKPFIWGFPLALFGLGAGFAARRILKSMSGS